MTKHQNIIIQWHKERYVQVPATSSGIPAERILLHLKEISPQNQFTWNWNLESAGWNVAQPTGATVAANIYGQNTGAFWHMCKITKGKNKNFEKLYTNEQKTNDEC